MKFRMIQKENFAKPFLQFSTPVHSSMSNFKWVFSLQFPTWAFNEGDHVKEDDDGSCSGSGSRPVEVDDGGSKYR